MVSNFISDNANVLHRLSLGIAKGPVIPAQAGHIGALVTATHGDEKLSVARQFVCQLLRLSSAEVNSDLCIAARTSGWTRRPGSVPADTASALE